MPTTRKLARLATLFFLTAVVLGESTGRPSSGRACGRLSEPDRRKDYLRAGLGDSCRRSTLNECRSCGQGPMAGSKSFRRGTGQFAALEDEHDGLGLVDGQAPVRGDASRDLHVVTPWSGPVPVASATFTFV